MSTTAEQSTILTTRLPASIKSELDDMAKSTGRNRNALVQEALRRFLEVERWQIADIKEAMRAADAGDFASDEEMEQLWAKYLTAPGVHPD